MKKLAIAFAILVPLVLVWIFWGRFAVEGGKATWSIINDRPDVLEAALKSGVSDKDRDEAFGRALSKGRAKEARLLHAAGAKLDRPGFCSVGSAARWGDVKAVQLHLELGLGPATCADKDRALIIPDFIQYASGRASEGELIETLKQLRQQGAPLDAQKALAVTRNLKDVAAWVRDPDGAAAAPVKKLSLVGDGPSIERDALKNVCLGEGVAQLPVYSKKPGEVSPILNFERRGDEIFFPGRVFPEWWTPWNDLRHVQVVACARVVDKKVANQCRYEGSGGGITIYDATYELELREAKTGKRIDGKTVSLTSDHNCPVVKFEKHQTGIYPRYEGELEALARAHIGVD